MQVQSINKSEWNIFVERTLWEVPYYVDCSVHLINFSHFVQTRSALYSHHFTRGWNVLLYRNGLRSTSKTTRGPHKKTPKRISRAATQLTRSAAH